MARIFYENNSPLGSTKFSDARAEFQCKEIFFEAACFSGQAVQIELPIGLPSGDECYAVAQVWQEQGRRTYQGETYYLPDGIVFADSFEQDYPEHYFVVASVAGKLDIREVRDRRGLKFLGLIKSSRPVSDPEVLQKIQRSVDYLAASMSRQEEVVSFKRRKAGGKISDHVVQACRDLALTCGFGRWRSLRLAWHLTGVKGLKESPYEIYSVVSDFLYGKKWPPLFLYRDWKDDLAELYFELFPLLQKNYGITDLTALETLGEERLLGDDGVLEGVAEVLAAWGLQLLYVDSDGDDYMFVLHPLEKFLAVKRDMHDIGWRVEPIGH